MLRCKKDSGEFRLLVSSWSCPEGRPPTLLGKSLTSSSVRFARLCQRECTKETMVLTTRATTSEPEHQHGEEQRKNFVCRNPVKMNCKNHGRWPHGCNLCFWKSFPSSLLILKHTRNITEWRMPDRQQKTLNAVENNYIFLRYFQFLNIM